MADTDYPVTQLKENEAVALTETAFTAALTTNNHGVIPEGDIASTERVSVIIEVTTAGEITFLAGDYGPGIRSSHGDHTEDLAIGTHAIVLESSRFVREDGTVRWQGDGTVVGTLAVLAMPRSLAGRTGQTAIPANPKAY